MSADPARRADAAEAKVWFGAYCAPCHGLDAKGHGPVAPAFKRPPTDLTALAKRNNGKFPEDYVKNVLKQGLRIPAHGSSEMPVWGPTFVNINERPLIRYLESMQVK
jgi:mono/diheme cytochrome c family protein